MNTPTIKASITYSEITPESAENGDTSDSGFVEESAEYTFSELYRLIRSNGFYFDGGSDWLSTGYSVKDYRTGTEREECLHFCRDNPERLRKWFYLAEKLAHRRTSNL